MQPSNVIPFRKKRQAHMMLAGLELFASCYVTSLHLYAAGWSALLGLAGTGKDKS